MKQRLTISAGASAPAGAEQVYSDKDAFHYEKTSSAKPRQRARFASASASLSEGVLSNSIPVQAACPPSPPPPAQPKVAPLF
jgi:hypothetical protein